MNRLMVVAGWLLLGLALPAESTENADYARQWPLTLSRDAAGAYRVELDATVYRQVQRPDLGDIEVRDGAGVAVPAALFAPDRPLAIPPGRVTLPWFALPATAGDGAGGRLGDGVEQGWELISQADADGHLRRVEARITDRVVRAAPRTALLVDLSRVRGAVTALELHWQPAGALDMGYRVEASEDLEQWQPLATRGRLVDLQRDGGRLLQRRIELDGLPSSWTNPGTTASRSGPRYLRLLPERRDQPLQITGVEALLAATTVAPPPQWLALQGQREAIAGGATFNFVLDGRFPIQQIDVALPGNHAIEWQLQSRDRPDGDWRARVAPWIAYQVDAAGNADRSAPRVLSSTVRDRHWRLIANGAVTGAPVLRLGYRPEVVVFLAQGAPPYTLVAGSARAQRAPAPLPQLIAELRARHGAGWQPSPAVLGASTELRGAAALHPARDWKTWLLWGVLALGALVVAGFAFALLRAGPPARGAGS